MLSLFSFLTIPPQGSEPLAVAVSGGPDSLLLAHLMHKMYSCPTLGLTIDHGVRKESATEAKQVAETLTTWGMSHKTLKLDHPKPTQAHLRQMRYEALATFCIQNNIFHLFLGHHKDDVLETFCMRLYKGAQSISALGAMQPTTYYKGILLQRPFLKLTRTDIMHLATEAKLPFMCDPSNKNKRFQRVRLRQNLALLETEKKKAWHSQSMIWQQKKACLIKQVRDLLPHFYVSHTPGSLTLKQEILTHLTLDLKIILIREILPVFGMQKMQPQTTKQILHILSGLQSHKKVTLGGCALYIKNGLLFFEREWQRIPPLKLSTKHRKGFVWDGRFFIIPPASALNGHYIIQPWGRIRNKQTTKTHAKQTQLATHPASPALFNADQQKKTKKTKETLTNHFLNKIWIKNILFINP